MRRSEILSAVSEILDAIQQTHVGIAIQELLGDRPGKPDRPGRRAPVESMRQWFLASSRFTEAHAKLLEIFDLTFLNDDAFWAAAIEGALEPPQIRRSHVNLRFAQEHLPKIAEMLEQAKVPDSETTQGASASQLLSVLVLENDDLSSTPQRIILVLQSIADLYEACAVVVGTGENSSLRVVACDSGSDKSFDFLGLAKIIECIKEVILSLWDRVIFFREHQLANRLELVAQSLPIIEKISDLEEKQRIAPEQAELMRRKVTSGATKFLESGAVIPEIQRSSTFNPRQLMAPSRKLLAGPHEGPLLAEGSTEDRMRATEAPAHDDLLSRDDVAELKRLLGDRGRGRKRSKPDQS